MYITLLCGALVYNDSNMTEQTKQIKTFVRVTVLVILALFDNITSTRDFNQYRSIIALDKMFLLFFFSKNDDNICFYMPV